MTLSFYCILCNFSNSLVVYFGYFVYKNTTRGTNFYQFMFIYSHIVILNFLWLYGVFHHFWYNLKYISYIVKIGGEGLCGENIPTE